MVDTYEHIIRKYDIKVGRQYIVDIPNMNRDDMARLFKELGFNKGAEIGVELGYYSKILCQSNRELKLSCVDPWLAEAYEPGVDAVDTEQEKYNRRYQETMERLKPFTATVIRKTSMDALADFADESLDFVYIDANHDFPNFIFDLHNWIKKVRPGGIVSGHDYARFSYKKHNHVKRALQAYSYCYRMHPLFVVGSMEYDKGASKPSINRDKYRSWFWVKK